MNHLYHDHVSTNMPKEEFKKLCSERAWDPSHGFVVVDLTSKKNNGKYRSELDCWSLRLSYKSIGSFSMDKKLHKTYRLKHNEAWNGR